MTHKPDLAERWWNGRQPAFAARLLPADIGRNERLRGYPMMALVAEVS